MKNLSKQMHKHIISVCVIRNLKYLYLETRVFVKIFWDKWTWVGGGCGWSHLTGEDKAGKVNTNRNRINGLVNFFL